MTLKVRLYPGRHLVPLILPFLVLLSGGCKRKVPPGATRARAHITSEGIKRTLHTVMEHKLSRVKAGSPDEAHVANWLSDTFAHYGLNPGGNRQTFFVEYPLSDNDDHQFARNVVAEAPGMRVINGGILLTTIYNHINTDELQSDSDAVKAAAARVATLLEIANATAGRPGDTPIYFSARSEIFMPEAKNVSTVLNLQNGQSMDDTLRITADSIPEGWRPFLGNLSDSLTHVDFHYHGITSSESPKVRINIFLPTKLWSQADNTKQRNKGLVELAHTAQIIRKFLYKIAMLQPEISTPSDSTQFAPQPTQ